MPGRVQQQVKPRIYTTKRGLDAVKHKGRIASTYDAPPTGNEGFTPGVNTDSIKANLSPGEYVLPNWLVQDIQAGRPPFPGKTPGYMHGGQVHDVPGFQYGGQVGAPQMPRSSAIDEKKLRPQTPKAVQPLSSPAFGVRDSRAMGTGAQSSTPGPTGASRTSAPDMPEGNRGGTATNVAPQDRADERTRLDGGRTRAGQWQRTAAARSGAGTRVHTRRAMQSKLKPSYSESGLWRGQSPGQGSVRGRPESGYEQNMERDWEAATKAAAAAAAQAGFASVEDQNRYEDFVQGQFDNYKPPATYMTPYGKIGPFPKIDSASSALTSDGGTAVPDPLAGVQAAEGTQGQSAEFDFSGEAPEGEISRSALDQLFGGSDDDDAAAAEAAKAEAETKADIEETEDDADERDRNADALILDAQNEPVPQYDEEDFAMEEAEIDKASRKAMGDALRIAGEQASAMGMPVGTSQGIQAQVTADVSAKAALAKANRFAQMRVQNMTNLVQQYDNKYKSLLMAAGMERDRARQGQLYAQAIDMQSRGKDIQKELLEYQDMLNTPTFWEGMLQILGTGAGVAAGAGIASLF